MPIYEYNCKDCGHQFEALRSMKEADQPIKCKKCLGESTTRSLSVFFAHSDGRSVASSTGGCGGCSGTSCSSCGHSH
jgi:putative FmdB family regulatory protein